MQYEIECKGFYGNGETDDKILWVEAPSLAEIKLMIAPVAGLVQKIVPIEDSTLDQESLDACLPADCEKLIKLIRERGVDLKHNEIIAFDCGEIVRWDAERGEAVARHSAEGNVREFVDINSISQREREILLNGGWEPESATISCFGKYGQFIEKVEFVVAQSTISGIHAHIKQLLLAETLPCTSEQQHIAAVTVEVVGRQAPPYLITKEALSVVA